MAYFDSGNSGAEDEAARRARLEAMQRAAGGYSWSGSDVNPTNTSARTDYGTVQAGVPQPTSSWSGSDPNQFNSSYTAPAAAGAWSPSADQLEAMQRAIAGVADANAAAKTAPTGYIPQGSWSGSDPNPTNSSAANPAAVSTATTGGSLASAINQPTGGSTLQPPTTPPGGQTTTTTTPDDRSTANLLAQMQTQTNAGAGGAGTGAGAGAGAGGAGAGGIQDQGAGAPSGGSIQNLTSSIMNQLQGIQASLSAPGTSSDVTGVYLQQSQSILRLLDEQEAQLRAEAEKAGTTVDPATEFTISKMRETLNENLKTVREDLNRRGLNDSGILLELENRLQKGSASDQAMVLADRLTRLQDELTKGLAGLRSQKVSTLQSFGRDAAQAQFTAGENQKRNALDREQEALRAMLNLRSQVSGEQNAAANRSFQGEQSALERAFNAEQAELDRKYGDAQYRARSADEFEQNRIAYEREKELIALRAANSGGGGSRPAAAARTAAAPANDVTQQAISDMRSVFTNATEANAAIKEQMRELAAAGVDIAALQAAANGLGGRRIGTPDY